MHTVIDAVSSGHLRGPNPALKHTQMCHWQGVTIDRTGGAMKYSARLAGILFIAGTTLWTGSPALAQRLAEPQLETQLISGIPVTQADGSTVLQPADTAAPGDILEYQVRYRNTGGRSIRSLTATLPVPPGTTHYVDGSARPAADLASIDGQHYDRIPLHRRIRRADGSEQMQRVPVSEYRFLRWQLGSLAAGQSITVTARMRVIAQDDATVQAEVRK